MKIFISYFYHIRNFPKNLLPVSTAQFDPAWYHERRDAMHSFTDKRGIINGLRIPELSPASVPEEYICSPSCDKDYKKCNFLKAYREYLNSLDFDSVMSKLSEMAENASSPDVPDMNVCLMVYETPKNPCSERVPLVEWFGAHGVDVKEFDQLSQS